MLHPAKKFGIASLLILSAGLLGPLQASAALMSYVATSLGGISWKYTYTVTNNGSLPASAPIEGFQVFFDYTKYDNLVVVTTPATWSPLVFQPDVGLTLDGVFDGLASPGPGITNGNSLGGFSVSFDWLVGGTPGAQPFEIYNANNFSVLETGGSTTLAAPVPGPAAVWLLGSGLAGLGFVRRRASAGLG